MYNDGRAYRCLTKGEDLAMTKSVAIQVLVAFSTMLASAAVPLAAAAPDSDGDGLPDADENFERTEGLDLIWKLQADPANVVLSSVTAELNGLKYYDTEYRWPAVYGARGTISVKVPKAGKFYPALVVYDSPGAETYELEIDGRRVGRFVAAEDDRRQRVHFLSQPIDFRGGERLTWKVGGQGSHVTEDVLLLAAKPPKRDRCFEIRQVEAAFVPQTSEVSKTSEVFHGGSAALRITWITTWPTACTIEYGTSAAYGKKTTEPLPVANHRLHLTGLKRGETIHYRILAPRPDGKPVTGPDQTLVFQPPTPPTGTAKRERTPLKVENPYDFAVKNSPITSGVPFAKGELPDADHVRLLDGQGREVLVQPKVTTRWPDGSVKWLLVSFLATVEARSAAVYALEYGTEVERAPTETLLRSTWHGKVLTVDTGRVKARFDRQDSGFPTITGRETTAPGEERDSKGTRLVATVGVQELPYESDYPPESIDVEEAGPVRVVVRSNGHHNRLGKKMFAYTARFTYYANSPMVCIDYTWENDLTSTAFSEFDWGLLGVRVKTEPRAWTIGLGRGKQASGQGDVELRQLWDNRFEIKPSPGASPATDRADGWIDVDWGRWGLLAAVRDFWQLYPKGFRVSSGWLVIDLYPPLRERIYDQCSELDKIKLYYYLQGGKYTVARGVTKQHQILLCYHTSDSAAVTEAKQRVQVFQEPLIAVCTPERYCGTGVFGEILPATTSRWPEYEKVCEKVYEGYVRNREAGHEYGMLNFGDQWGERKVNWANGEYDHHHAFLMQFARTGDRKWYFLGEKAARHAIDVDTCHHGPNRGGEWIHSMGHTGGYFTEPYQGNGIPGPGFTVSHTWTEGFYDWFALSGDPTGAENAALVADHYDGAYLNNYDYGNARTNGWHLLLTIAAYRATNDPYYLNAARIIVERTLERQTPGGGWHRQMVPGHCYDMPRHRGEANFMLGVLANGLEDYYREVADPRVTEAIIGGAKQAVKELWVEQSSGFRYTSCPNMTGYRANNDMTSEILFFAHRLSGDKESARIAMKAMDAAFVDGIGSIAHLRWTPHILYNMDRIKCGSAPGR